MPSKPGNQNQFLKQIGRSWYVSIIVPRTLTRIIGNTHIRRALGTRDLTEANRLKHRVVAEIKGHLAALRQRVTNGETIKHGLTFADARAIREAIRSASAEGNDDQVSVEQDFAIDRAEEIERLLGTQAAQRWYKHATNVEGSLLELLDRWLNDSDYKEATKDQHRHNVGELLSFMGVQDAYPNDVTHKSAVSFIDTYLKQRGQSHETIRRKINTLSTFWSYLQSKAITPAGVNPWKGHRVSTKAHKGSRPERRAYNEDELLLLLKANDRVRRWSGFTYLRDMCVLGLFTGAREEELCSLRANQIEKGRGHYTVRVRDSKTVAGIRPVGVTHEAPMAVLARRLATTEKDGLLFPELTPGGHDGKYSWEAVKAFTRYRRACGVADGADFHSFRRTVVTKLEHQGVRQVLISRFVGHAVGTLAADTYSEGGSKKQSLETARQVRYGKRVEAAALRAVSV